MKPYEKDYERALKIRRDFEARALAVQRSGDFTPFGKGLRLKALEAELKAQLRKIDPSIK